jgi:abortive infection bacteriophage resistance protein
MKKAIDVSRQIELLRQRGMTISDEDKAKEVLLDVGYYRLGFYWFPFEVSYPRKDCRTHEFRKGTKFDYIVKLYYFDFNLRNTSNPQLSPSTSLLRAHVLSLLNYQIN